jgi:DnaJ-class molecular chaperone
MVAQSYKMIRAQIMGANHAFQILGVHKGSPEQAVSAARRKLARYVHPDINGARDAEELMSRVNAAYTALTENRARYTLELNLKSCAACRGTGVLRRQKGFKAVVEVVCAVCHGAGGV